MTFITSKRFFNQRRSFQRMISRASANKLIIAFSSACKMQFVSYSRIRWSTLSEVCLSVLILSLCRLSLGWHIRVSNFGRRWQKVRASCLSGEESPPTELESIHKRRVSYSRIIRVKYIVEQISRLSILAARVISSVVHSRKLLRMKIQIYWSLKCSFRIATSCSINLTQSPMKTKYSSDQ